MKLDIPDEYVPLIVTALEHYAAYSRAAHRKDARYQEAADWFKAEACTCLRGARAHNQAKAGVNERSASLPKLLGSPSWRTPASIGAVFNAGDRPLGA
jgi:hypothetical protein